MSSTATSELVAAPYATDALLVCMAIIWGVNASVMKVATNVMPPLVFNAARLGLAAVALVALALGVRGSWPTRRDVAALLALGLLGTGLYQVFMIEGLARTRAGTTALILASGPAFVAIFGRMLGVERITPRALVGILLSMVGIALVALTLPAELTRSASLVGNLLVLVGCLCWSLFTVLIKPYANRLDGRLITAITVVGGTIPISLIAIPEIHDVPWESLALATWGAIVYAGLASMVIAYLFWNRGVRLLGPTRTSMYGNLQPLFALTAAWLMLGERPIIWQVIGAVGIIGGVIMTRTAEPIPE
jgi:drug/metabolite transporter (DMT)-like permease